MFVPTIPGEKRYVITCLPGMSSPPQSAPKVSDMNCNHLIVLTLRFWRLFGTILIKTCRANDLGGCKQVLYCL